MEAAHARIYLPQKARRGKSQRSPDGIVAYIKNLVYYRYYPKSCLVVHSKLTTSKA